MPEHETSPPHRAPQELPPLGLRVRLLTDLDTLVLGAERTSGGWLSAPRGALGTVVEADADRILVQLDEVPEEADWSGLIWWDPADTILQPFWETVAEAPRPSPGSLRYGLTLRLAVEVDAEDLRERGPAALFAQVAAFVIGEEGLDRDQVTEWAFERGAER